jgi:hypothetical protein
MNYKEMVMDSRDKEGQRVIMRGMLIRVPWIMSKKCMGGIFKHWDVACVAECLITMQNPSKECQHYHADI